MAQVTITANAPGPLTFILEHLRPEDQEELEAVRGTIDPFKMALELCRIATTFDGWLFWNEDTREPIAALGAYAMTPKVVGCWAFGTEDWPVVIKAMTRHVKRIMIPKLLKAGFHRAECRALAKREDTERWLTGLGWVAESRMSGFGVRREDFTLFAWLAPDEPTDHPLRSEQQSEVPVR